MTVMMKRIELIYFFLLAMALPLLVACSNDDVTSEGGMGGKDGKVSVHLRISQARSATTRGWQDDNGKDEEMMNVWTVVVVYDDGDNKNNVAAIYACKPSDPYREIDDLVELPAIGKYRFYSFANMSPTKVMELLKIGLTKVEGIGSIDDFNTDALPKDRVIRISSDGAVEKGYAEKIAVPINGNGFDPSSKSDNGFGSYGIPMSNVQTIEVKDDGDMIDLVVIRMLAKVTLQVYNDSGSDITLKSVTLTNLTANISSNLTSTGSNLMLLPKISEEGSNTMEAIIHGDIQPNLYEKPEQEDLTLDNINSAISPSANQYSPVKGTPVEFTFYVNESESPNNNYECYSLKIMLERKTEDGSTEVTEERYALIDHKGATTADDDRWLYIARNDYRIIPIVLDAYKLDIIPYDFPAIGVYPASVKGEDGIYTITFHDYGHFHLLPLVTKGSEIIPFKEDTAPAETTGYAETSWGFVDDDFNKSWTSWYDFKKESKYVNEGAEEPFYRKGYNVTPPVDGDEVGGEPVWYPNNTPESPQWAPNDQIGYQPFIFGYIADPEDKVTEDRKVYHEFTVNLYRQGMTTPTQMTYRLYMILDTQQMMYRSRSLGAPVVRHTHGH